MINVSLNPDVAVVECTPDTIFVEYSYGIESAINWFFGRGVSKFRAERSKNGSNQVVTVKPLMPVKPLAFSNVTSVGLMVKEGYWPHEIEPKDRWIVPGERHEIRDGQHRIWRANKEGSIIQTFGILPHTSFGELAYGMSDMITGFFWLGATWVKYQGSLGLTQIYTDKGFSSGEDLAKYLTDEEPGYSIHQKVATLP